MKSACFTGHRIFDGVSPTELEFALIQLIERSQLDFGITHYYCGMAIGTDMMAAKVLTNMGLPWTACIPCPEQADKWDSKCRKTYFSLLSQASGNVVTSAKYSRNSFMIRNSFMVQKSDLLISVWDEREREGSGTFGTVKLAQKKRIPILNWNPLAGKTKLFKPKKPNLIQLDLHLTILI